MSTEVASGSAWWGGITWSSTGLGTASPLGLFEDQDGASLQDSGEACEMEVSQKRRLRGRPRSPPSSSVSECRRYRRPPVTEVGTAFSAFRDTSGPWELLVAVGWGLVWLAARVVTCSLADLLVDVPAGTLVDFLPGALADCLAGALADFLVGVLAASSGGTQVCRERLCTCLWSVGERGLFLGEGQ